MTGVRSNSRLIIAAALLGAAAPAMAAPADLKARADAYLDSAWPADGPGAAVIIVEDGKTVYARGRGLADVEAGTPITPETVFRLGSITKQFSAAVIMQLVQEGKLSLDDPLSKFLPDYPKPGADATVRQLLNHTVGVQSYTGIPGWMVEENTARPYTTEQMIALFKDMPVVSQPGQAWAYNNSGYVLVGAVIEKVTGKPWHQAVEERVARPLGLKTIRYGVGEENIANMAKGYTEGEGGKQKPARRIHMSVPHAAGALVGNVIDLARWGQALHHGKVVGADAYGKMIAATAMPDGKSTPYGFGLARDAVRGRDTIRHGGGIFGFSTESLYVPGDDLFVAVFANSDDPATDPSIAALRLAAMTLGDPFPDFKPAQVAQATLEPLFGIYRAGEGPPRSFYARDGEIYTQRGDGPDLKVIAAGDDRFYYGPGTLTWFQIRRDSAGAHVMEMHQNGASEPEKAVRTGPVPPPTPEFPVPRATLETYLGTYALGPGKATIAWGASPDTLTIQLAGQEPRRLRAMSANEFRVEGVGARIVFQAEGGHASKLVIHQGERQMVANRVP